MVSILMTVSILLGACGSSTSQESSVRLKRSSDDKGNASKMIETDMAWDTDVVMEEQEIAETENVSEDDSVTHTYTATVRVPKDKYETVMNQSGEIFEQKMKALLK